MDPARHLPSYSQMHNAVHTRCQDSLSLSLSRYYAPNTIELEETTTFGEPDDNRASLLARHPVDAAQRELGPSKLGDMSLELEEFDLPRVWKQRVAE